MASNASRGAAAKARTKKWLILNGYQVADLEKVHWIWTPTGRLPTKRDQFGSDLLAVSSTEIVFVQCKSGAQAKGHGQFLAAQREFAKYRFPSLGVALWIVAWAPRAREPRVIEVVTSIGDAGSGGDSVAGARPRESRVGRAGETIGRVHS